jgi:propionyl-CoA carboxylase alpha chain
VVRIDGVDYAVSLEEDAITVDGNPVAIALEYTPGDRLIDVELYGDDAEDDEAEPVATYGIQLAPRRWGYRMTTRGAQHEVRVLPAHVAPLAQHMIEKVPPDLSKFLICPMPGLLVQLHVSEGDEVQPGQPLATVEAMKMENILRAEKSAKVAKINAAQGASLAVDEVILELE